MRNLLSALTFMLSITALNAYAQDSMTKQWLSFEQIQQDTALAKEAYERIHPGYTRYTEKSQLDDAWQGLLATANASKGMTVANYYLGIQQVLTQIHCDHTKANLPATAGKERDTQPFYLPFKWVWLDGRAFITAADSSNTLKRKDEILAIDGVSIALRVAQVIDYIPYDGRTRWSRQSGVAQSLEFKGGAVDHFGSLIWENKATVNLEIRTTDGKEQSLTLPRINYKQWRALQSSDQTAANFKDAVTFKVIDERSAYLRIDTFVNYRTPVKPDEIYAPIFKQLKQSKTTNLILDLRNNGGGSSDASLGLLRYLLDEKKQVKLAMRAKTIDHSGLEDHLWTWDKRALNPSSLGFKKQDDGTYALRSLFTDELDTIKPARNRFSGQIIALTSHANSSGSTNVLAVLNEQDNVTLVGEPTGGTAQGPTAGVLFTLTLPESGITTRIPKFIYTNNVQSAKPGLGVMPDVDVSISANDWLQDIDPTFEAALAFIKQEN